MKNVLRKALFLALASGVAAAGAQSNTEKAKQAGIKLGPSPACNLITAAEFEKITGRKNYSGAGGTQLANGGSSCDYSGGNVTLFSGPKSAASYENLLKIFKADSTPREPVSGIGDRAYFMAPKPQNEYQGEHGMLVVNQGQHTLAVAIQTQGKESPKSLQPKLISLAKTAMARLP